MSVCVLVDGRSLSDSLRDVRFIRDLEDRRFASCEEAVNAAIISLKRHGDQCNRHPALRSHHFKLIAKVYDSSYRDANYIAKVSYWRGGGEEDGKCYLEVNRDHERVTGRPPDRPDAFAILWEASAGLFSIAMLAAIVAPVIIVALAILASLFNSNDKPSAPLSPEIQLQHERDESRRAYRY